MQVNIAEFTKTPGPAFKIDGEFSGEWFREDILIPKLQEAVESEEILIINLDGVIGFGYGFLKEAFGGLARELGIELIVENIQVVCNDELEIRSDVFEIIFTEGKLK